jgi:excisionase family DNA binding protein
VTPARFERATCGLGIGPRPQSSESQNVSAGIFTLKTEDSNVSPCVTETLDSQSFLTRLLPGGRLLTLNEVAQYLAVEIPLVEKLVSEKALRVVRIGPEIRVRPEDLKAFVAGAEE